MTFPLDLPDNLPQPEDDGACRHLPGSKLPDLSLPATDGRALNLSHLEGTAVIYCYPRTSQPDLPAPPGWDEIPGARGCTPQSCAFRDHHAELRALGASVYGISTQDTAYQQEMVQRLNLSFPVLSDANLEFGNRLNMPTFDFAGQRLLKRVTLIVSQGVIEAVHYPVFPSTSDPIWVIEYLSSRSAQV